MRERLLDVIKWAMILVLAGAVYYVVCPKFEFKQGSRSEQLQYRCNKVTGQVEFLDQQPVTRPEKPIKGAP